MAYEFDEFVADCRIALANGATPAALESVRLNLERLLANEAFVKAHFGPDATGQREVLHSDEKLGFQVYAHLPAKAAIRPPHDHANSWAIYGQVAEHTDMTDWELADGAGKPHPVRTYRLLPGDAGIFDVGALHSIDYCDGARFARVTGSDIDDAPVRIFKDVDVRAEIAAHLSGDRRES